MADQYLVETKRLMGALVRMKPKPHEEMKLNKKRPGPRSKAGRSRKAKPSGAG